ncbi:MAG TPA: ATP-binding protein [Candidatus Saccharimonadales bacterium]|nr:ATP-binding protein [Candidatus Saccharimonadales bacterium]
MNLDLVILIISSIAIALLGLMIIVRNPSEQNNRRFAFLAAAMISWIVFNYLSDYSKTMDLLFTQLVFAAGTLSISGLLLFIFDFPNKSLLPRKFVLLPQLCLTAIFLPLFFTGYFITSVGAESINLGPLYTVFELYVVYSLVLYAVIARHQAARATGHAQKRQVGIVFWSIAIYAALAVLTNVILPLMVGSWVSSRLGPIFSLVFVAAIAYSIVKYRLFDIKLLIFRSVGYVLSIAMIGAVSFVALSWLSGVFDSSGASRGLQIDVYVIVTLFLVVLYQPSKKLFERFVARIFYKDAYDTRTLFDEFNQALASTIILEDLLDRSGRTIEKFLKTQKIASVIRSSEGKLMFIDSDPAINRSLIGHLEAHFERTKDSILVADMLEEDQNLKRLLRKAEISVVAPIASSKAGSNAGYLILGYKKSGDGYNRQDIAALRTLVNGLSIAVQNALQFEEIQQFNLKLEQRVEEATRHLRQTNAKLRMLDETKDDFISMASHQLRTPLTSVKGYVSMVLDGDAGKITPLQRKLLNQSFVSSQRMVYLISDLLNLSRLRTGKFVIEPTPCNLADIIKGEIEQLKETAKGRSLELAYQKPEHFPTYMLDETKLRQVIMNFVDNAIYYTPAGGRVTVNLVEKPETIEFTVVDNGIGVPRHEQHHLFSKFYRANNAKRARPDGTGLGLFMAKKVVIAQGGAIIFKSQEGKGSTFGFSFAKSKLVHVQK